MDQKPSYSYPVQFFMLIGLFGGFLIISSIVIALLGSLIMHIPLANVLGSLESPQNTGATRLLNTVATCICFLLPALIFAKIVYRTPFSYLGFSKKISIKQVLIIFVITIGAMILSGALGELNEKIPISKSFYEQARKLEDLYRQQMLNMAAMRSFGEYLVVLLVIAAAPAMFEEILFRGALQQIMVGWTRSKWAGIIIASILFSAFHFSYFGFLPRLALGIILGLIFYNSRNIWLNILLHFLNNAIVVTQLYIVSLQGKSIEKTLDENMPSWWGLAAVVLLAVAFRAFNKEARRVWSER